MKERLLEIADLLGLSVRKFEHSSGLQRGNISNMSDNGAIGSDKLSKIFDKFPQINPEWLLTGKGAKLRSYSVLGKPKSAEEVHEAIPQKIRDAMTDQTQEQQALQAPLAQENTATAREELLKEQLREKDAEIKALNREIGRLQSENELLRKKT
jgi:hypothetical protein